MKKILLIIFLILVFLISSFLFWKFFLIKKVNLDQEKLGKIAQLSPTSEKEEEKEIQEVNFQGKKYRLAFTEIDNLSHLFLWPNFEEEQKSEELFSKQDCQFLVNAGFYNLDRSPIGLFLFQGEILNQSTINSTFNGFLEIKNQTVEIRTNFSNQSPRIGLQTGPILLMDGKTKTLNLKNDKPARRTIAAITNQGKLIFLVIYDPDSLFQGPYLKDLPEILKMIEKEINLNFQSAINLDGGTASAFYSKELKLTELQPIGGYFCYQN